MIPALYSQISQITSISNENLYQEFDSYSRSVLRYEDRLIVQCAFKIEDYNILPNGELERKGFIETKWSFRGYIDNGRFYLVRWMLDINLHPHGYKVEVFDLTTSPMQKINEFEFRFSQYNRTSYGRLYFTEDYVLLFDDQWNRYVLFNRATYTFERFLSLPFGTDRILHIKDDIVVMQSRLYLKFYRIIDKNTFEMELISELLLQTETGFISEFAENDGRLVLNIGMLGVIVIDIQDEYNPVILYEIPVNMFSLTALYSDNLLFTISNFDVLHVYDLLENGEYSLRHQHFIGHYNVLFNVMYFDAPYLYINQGDALYIYDLTDGFIEVASYGNHELDYFVFTNQNNVFMTYRERINDEKDMINNHYVYNILDNELLFSFQMINEWWSHLTIEDNILFMRMRNIIDNTVLLNIYQIMDQQIELLYSRAINSSIFVASYNTLNNKVLLSNLDNNFVEVYDFIDNELQYLGQFSGRMQINDSMPSQNYILNLVGNRVLVRDMNDFNTILATLTIPGGNWGYEFLIYYSDEYFLLYSSFPGSYRVYRYNVGENTISEIHRFQGSPRLNVTNHIITVNAYRSVYISEYYSIIDGAIVKIGEKHDQRDVEWTYFFPERNKMVQYCLSGILVYDFEYEIIVSEDDRVVELPSMNVRVFPNPVRSGDVSFRIASSQAPRNDKSRNEVVDIGIYNIRGQLVRKVSDITFKDGEGTFVWDRRNDRGQEVASGVYFYRVTGSGYQMTGRFLVMK